MLKPGDKVVMNDRYYVSAENKGAGVDGPVRALEPLRY